MGSLKGKIAVITGAGQGIGEGIALRLADDGASVVVTDINEENALKVSKEIKSRGRDSIALKVDVSNWQLVKEMAEKIIQRYKRIDILVANAGICQVKPAEDISEEDWDNMININLKGVFLTNKVAIPIMKKQGGGRIINCSSTSGRQATAFLAHYSAAKFGVIGLTQAIARELAKYNITVNAYCPGLIDTPMWDKNDAEFAELWNMKPGEPFNKFKESTPLGRAGLPSDVGNIVSFLASDNADWMTGQSIMIDGGMVM
jgi:acetoin reductase-like protein